MRILLATSLFLLLAACGTERASDDGDRAARGPSGAPSDTPSDAPTPMPTEVPPPRDDVKATGLVMDTGRPELCLGAVAESWPPQCRGIPLAGWDWDRVDEAQYERQGDVRWGEFQVVGSYDGTSVQVRSVRAAGTVDPASAQPDLSTKCPEPDGGWPSTGPAPAGTPGEAPDGGAPDQSAVFAKASTLEGYAAAWLDAQTGVVNVAVTGDVAEAEAALRDGYDGPLCVVRAEHTEAQLQDIADDMPELPGFLGSSAFVDRVDVEVVWDDGTLQRWADAAYGEGLVRVRSRLVPVP